MQFVLYSEKSVAECVKAINERLGLSATATRPALDGHAAKSGTFTLGLRSAVFGRFYRKTWLRGQILREGGTTLIRGSVPDGAPPSRQRLIAFAIPISGVALALSGAWIAAAAAMGLLLALLVILRGDYRNGDRLLLEIERLLKASPRSPKKPAPAKK